MIQEGFSQFRAGPEDIRRQRQEVTRVRLDRLVSAYGLDPGIAAAYGPEMTGLYGYPGLDPAFGDRLDELKAASIAELQDISEEAFDHHFASPDDRLKTRLLRQRFNAHGSADDARLTAAIVRHAGTEDSVTFAMITDYFGMMRSDLHGYLLQATVLHYFFELNSVNYPLVFFDSGVPAFFKDFAIDPEVPVEVLGLRDVAINLRLKDVVDLSPEHLNARVAIHAAVVQLEAAKMLLDSLGCFARLKPSDGPRRAAALADRYADALMGDDTAGKVELATMVAGLYRQYKRQVRDQRSRQMLEAFVRDATALAEDLPRVLAEFASLYAHFGYAIPPSLRHIVAPNSPAEAGRPAEPEAAMGQMAIRRELQAQKIQLNARAEAFSQSWRLSAQERRDRGFGVMQRALVTGYPDASERPVLAAIPKDQARQAIDVLARFYELVGDDSPAEAMSRLDVVLAEEVALRARVTELQQTARAAGTRIEAPVIVPVRAVVESVRASWAGYWALISQTWPERRGQQVGRRLDQIFRKRS